MKTIILTALFLFCLSLQIAKSSAYECEENKKTSVPLKFDSIDMLYGDLAPVIKRSVAETIKEFKSTDKTSGPKAAYIISNLDNTGVPVVFGLTEKQVLEMDRDEHGEACSDKHNHDDMSNRWCHAYFVKLVYETAREKGIPNMIAAAMGASIFVVKEYAIDLHPSMPDLVIADYELFRSNDKNSVINGTLFGDRMFFITYKTKF